MELALSLGDTSKPFKFLDSSNSTPKDLGFCMGLSRHKVERSKLSSSDNSPRPLDLLPLSPVPRRPINLLPWLHSDHSRMFFLSLSLYFSVCFSRKVKILPFSFSIVGSEPGSTDGSGTRGFDVNRVSAEETEEGAALSSPNSAASSFQMDFGFQTGRGSKREIETERASDDEENGSTRKKLRLSKEQSAFLEESFKEHNTLNPVSQTN